MVWTKSEFISSYASFIGDDGKTKTKKQLNDGLEHLNKQSLEWFNQMRQDIIGLEFLDEIVED